MILVDASVWVDYFSTSRSVIAQKLESLLKNLEELVIIDLILLEVLQGFKKDSDFNVALDILTQVPNLELNQSTYISAAKLFRLLRKNGITINSTVDFIIAQVCIEREISLFTIDSDFLKIQQHSSLMLI